MRIPDTINIVGCGGTGSWLVPLLLRLIPKCQPVTINLIDGDTLEEKNLDRQLFDASQVGQSKAHALLDRYANTTRVPAHITLVSCERFFVYGDPILTDSDALWFVCVDNHPARMAVLQTIDERGGTAIVCGNEYTDSDAYIYNASDRNTFNDPRVRHPEITTITDGDPTSPVGCTGLAQALSPQLALANFGAAYAAAHLFWFHFVYLNTVPTRFSNQAAKGFPVWHVANLYQLRTFDSNQLSTEYGNNTANS